MFSINLCLFRESLGNQKWLVYDISPKNPSGTFIFETPLSKFFGKVERSGITEKDEKAVLRHDVRALL